MHCLLLPVHLISLFSIAIAAASRRSKPIWMAAKELTRSYEVQSEGKG
jgi:hypothetical protein